MAQSDTATSIDEFVNPEKRKKPKTTNWAAFVESEIVNFFNLHEFEKMTIEDGNGNKAKIIRQKDNAVKIETSSTTVI